MEQEKTDIIDHTAALGRPLVVTGLMGAGKTSIGRRVARRLGLPFFDSDHEIEKAADCSVAEFFERYGEKAFREDERRLIARLLGTKDMVLAIGGGAFIDKKTRALIKKQAISIWLKADLELLVKHTARRKTRPLLLNGDARTILRRLMKERDPIYAEADITVVATNETRDQMAAKVLAAVKTYVTDMRR